METVLMATLLAVFSALEFVVPIITDAEMHASYFMCIREHARQVLAVRARYRRFQNEAERFRATPDAIPDRDEWTR